MIEEECDGDVEEGNMEDVNGIKHLY